MEKSEKLIIEMLKSGDEKAYRYIYDNHYVMLCRFANQILNDASIAEEIVNDVIFNLWQNRSKMEITHSLRTYLIRSVRNRCLNELNTLSHRIEIPFSSFILPENIDFLNSVFSSEDHPLGSLIEQELEDELNRSIEELPVECRNVFMKSRFEQKKYDEIANELNITVNTVKYHIKNALSHLRKRLWKYLFLLFYFF